MRFVVGVILALLLVFAPVAAICSYTNITGVTVLPNSSSHFIASGNTQWGVEIIDNTSISIYSCGDDLIVGPSGYTNNFSSFDKVRVNQSTIQDPMQGKSAPWWLWILSGYIGLGLLVIALLKPRTYRMDYEINIILSVVAWPFIWYWTWGGLTSVDYIVGTAITATQGETVMITQHILYTPWVLGWIGVGGCILAVFLTVLLASQYELFNENEGKVQAKAEQKEKEEL